jgi:copper chaperone CopZ
MEVLLTSREITCDHCIASIRRVVDAMEGVRFVSGDPERKTFVVDSSAPRYSTPSPICSAQMATHWGCFPALFSPSGVPASDWRPAGYHIERTEVGANVNDACYCGCDAGFGLDRRQADQAPESSCCGNRSSLARVPRLESPHSSTSTASRSTR